MAMILDDGGRPARPVGAMLTKSLPVSAAGAVVPRQSAPIHYQPKPESRTTMPKTRKVVCGGCGRKVLAGAGCAACAVAKAAGTTPTRVARCVQGCGRQPDGAHYCTSCGAMLPGMRLVPAYKSSLPAEVYREPDPAQREVLVKMAGSRPWRAA